MAGPVDARPAREHRHPASSITARALILVAAANLLLLALVLGAIRLSGQMVDHDTAAEAAAVNYTHAVLTHDYSAWWDAVSPTCRTAPDTATRSDWLAAAKGLGSRAGLADDPASIAVVALRATGSGATRVVEIQAKNLWTHGSDYFEMTVRQVDGRWGVTNRTSPGAPPARDCDVWAP